MSLSFPRSLSVFALFVVFFAALPARVLAAVKEYAVIETSKGTLEVELWAAAAPITVRNFKYLADSRFYDDTAFHRLLAGFMVQGGDPLTRDPSQSANFGRGGPGYTIPDEVSTDPARAHTRGVISMAHAGANTGGSQFFLMFGDASNLDGVHTTFGKLTDTPANVTVLAAIEAETTVPVDAQTRKPVERLVVKSVRVRAEVSAPDTAVYKAATYSGLLRLLNRSSDTGSYTISVTALGAFSGTVQYFGRSNRISGKFVRSVNGNEAVYTTTLDPNAAVPLRLELGLRLASSLASATNTLSIQVTDSKVAGVTTTSTMSGSGESFSAATLAERYTVLLEAPTNGGQYALSSLNGFGSLTLTVNRFTGFVTANGFLSDGTVYTAVKRVTSENGRFLFSLYDTKWQSAFEAQRSTFASKTWSEWNLFLDDTRYLLSQLRGSVELPKAEPRTATASTLIWLRAGKTTGAIRSHFAGYVSAYTAPWVRPAAGTTLAPFSAVFPRGQLQINGLAPLEFTLNKTNTAGIFARSPMNVTLSINLAAGTFSGSYREITATSMSTRSFRGVLLPFTNVTGFGYSLDPTSSRAVQIVPLAPPPATPTPE
jgi:peptidyl-prolyl cis-trans isomerase B (cyclophilin B)